MMVHTQCGEALHGCVVGVMADDERKGKEGKGK